MLRFKSLWGCQISEFKSFCRKSSSRLKAFAGNSAGEAGAHNKIPALHCIEIPKQKAPLPVQYRRKILQIYIFKKDKKGNDEGNGRYQFSVKQQDWDQRTPLQSSIHRSSISKYGIQELEATFEQTSFK